MDAGQALVISHLRDLEDGLDGRVADDLLQWPRGAELCGDVERRVALVVGDVDRGTGDEQFPHGLDLLEVCSQMKGGLCKRERERGRGKVS